MRSDGKGLLGRCADALEPGSVFHGDWRCCKVREICLVTFHKNNYGSMLQSYALIHVLSGWGYQVHMLEKFKVRPYYLRHPVMGYARLSNRMSRKKRKAFFSPIPYELPGARKARLEEFARSYFNELSILSAEQWKRVIDSNMIFIAGSDIIWQPNRGYPADYFLDFAVHAGLRCFSYASSIGAKELPRRFYRAYRRYLRAFKCVGVREEAAVGLLEPIIGREVTKVVDPTLLLGPSDWDELAAMANLSVDVDPGGYIFCYFVMEDPRYWDYVEKVASSTGLQVIVLPMHHSDEQRQYPIVSDAAPYEFVWLVKNAELVLTDSFHACCFSMQYEKEFYLMRRARKTEDDKYDDFLGRYGLVDRVVTDESEFARQPRFDYSGALERLAEDRAESLGFLSRALAD